MSDRYGHWYHGDGDHRPDVPPMNPPYTGPLPRRHVPDVPPVDPSEAETARIYTATPTDATNGYDEAAARFREQWAETGGSVGILPDPTPEQLEIMTADRERPPWNGFDTFLRRTRDVLVIITCLVLLYAAWRGWVLIGALQDAMKEIGAAWNDNLIGTETPLIPTADPTIPPECWGEEPC